ncbi:hypothetical protein [Polaribacter pacificus]|uniref:hypothetical protein n=1 Tax=Polaribacter pacificus TaxID=1775173 RepID=UPI0016681683|nr:hypothetical protein [Polaribacter pacificus]
MKKQILNLGKALSKAEQRNVFGGSEEHPCSGNYHMFPVCLCFRSKSENCASGVCNGTGTFGFCA